MIYRLDPRIKIIFVLIFSISLFFIKTPAYCLLPAAFLLLVVVLSRLSFKSLFRAILPLTWLIFFTFVLNLFFTKKGEILFSSGFLKITKEGLDFALIRSIRLVLLVFAAALFSLTTNSADMQRGLMFIIFPLKIFGISPRKVALTMTLAWGFLPELLNEWKTLVKNRQFKKIFQVLPLLAKFLKKVFRQTEK